MSSEDSTDSDDEFVYDSENDRVFSFLEGDAADFVCENNPNRINHFVFTKKGTEKKMVVFLCNDIKHDHVFIALSRKFESFSGFGGLYRGLRLSGENGTYNHIIGAVLRRLPKELLVAWLMRHLMETHIHIHSDQKTNDRTRWVRSDFRWFIAMRDITLYELTEAGRARLVARLSARRGEYVSPAGVVLLNVGYPPGFGIVLPLTMDDLKPIFAAYQDIMNAHQWVLYEDHLVGSRAPCDCRSVNRKMHKKELREKAKERENLRQLMNVAKFEVSMDLSE